ncbi:MAG: YicC family protein [FCB group bacterium]|nr:YicC family protein [FCB group bacterium]
MTGFGRGTLTRPQGQLTITVRSVNSRYLDLKIKGTDFPPELDGKIRELVTRELHRGSVMVIAEVQQNGAQQSLKFNRERYEALESILLGIQREYGRHLDMGQLVSMNDLFMVTGVDEFSSEEIQKTLSQAIREVVRMRLVEGRSMSRDIQEVLSKVKERLTSIESNMETINQEIIGKHRQRIKALIEDYTVDDGRIEQELALLLDKMDIREEVVRCASHIEQFLALLNQEGPVGKQMNFLLQEMGREINTIGSKAGSTEIINTVIDLKSDIEKIREQVQNIL